MSAFSDLELFYVQRDTKVLNERGSALAVVNGITWKKFFSSFFSGKGNSELHGLDGELLVSFADKRGHLGVWLKIWDPEGELLAKFDRQGNAFATLKDCFSIEDASGRRFGRVEDSAASMEYVVFDESGTRVASGRPVGEDSWEVRKRTDLPDPWPIVIPSFFLALRRLRMPHPLSV